MKLMIVDDEFIVRVGIRSILNWEEYGYVIVAEAASGNEALEKIEQFRPDIVLTDIVMDNMDGFELIRLCREKHPEVNFVVLSGYNDFENVRQAMKLGAKDYIFKLKANPEEILRTLNDISRFNGEKGDDPEKKILDGVIHENLQSIKYNLIHKWVNSTEFKEEEIISRFSALSLKVDLLKPYLLLYVRINDFTSLRISGEIKDVQLVKSSMENTIYEILSAPRNVLYKDISAEVFSLDEGDMVVFINTDEENSFFYELYSKIQEYCKRYLGIEVSATISPVMTGVDNFCDTLDICRNTLNHRTGAAMFLPYNKDQRNEIAIVKNYIASHFNEKFGIREAASLAAMSENYFSHFFKKETGSSFVDYLNRIRMEKAAELLEKGSQKITTVAGQVGIDSPNYFSVLFKKVMGCSPQEFREKLKT